MNMAMIDTVFPGWETGERIDTLRAEVDRLTAEVQRLDAVLEDLDDGDIYSDDYWGEQYSQRQVVERRTARQIHIQPRFVGDKKIVLDRQKLERDGEVWHRRKYQHYTLGREVRRILQDRRQETRERLARHRRCHNEAEANWIIFGAALDDHEMTIVDAFGITLPVNFSQPRSAIGVVGASIRQ